MHLLQEGQDVPDLLHDSRSQAGRIIALDESAQSPMNHVSDLHQVRLHQNLYCVKIRFTAAAARALVSVAFSFDDEPTVNSQGELAVATSGSHNLRRRSNG